jgi:hypothetical protein
VSRAYSTHERNAYKIFVGKLERKGPLGRRKLVWEDNTAVNLTEILRTIVDWIHLAQNRDNWRTLLNTVMKLFVL